MFKQIGIGTAVGLACLGLGVTAQAASAQHVISQKTVTKYGKVTENVAGSLYAFKNTDQTLTLTATHQLKKYPHTAWIVSRSALVQMADGQSARYNYVTSTSSKTTKQVSGWVLAHDLKTPAKVNLGAPYISQNAVKAWMGCESASLLEGLQDKGVLKSTGLVAFMRHLPRSKNNNPNNGFAGSPYKVTPGVFQSIFPKPLAKWGNTYTPVKNISGASLAKLRSQLRLHNPVVVYVTLHFAKAQYGHYFWGTGINNSHVMLLDGYKAGAYHVADPNHGKYWVSAKKFARSYNYKHFAVAVQ